MRNKIEELGDRLLSRIVPRSTATASHCYHTTQCRNGCGSPSGPPLRWRYEYSCCVSGSTVSCSLYRRSCSCT